MLPATTPARAVGRRPERRWLLAAIAVAVLAYRPVLQMSFVGDDFLILHLLRQAGGLQHPGAYFQVSFFGYYRPIAFLSHAVDWQIWHGQAIGFHLTSLLLHAANTALVFVNARRLFGLLPAAVASLIFTLHPSNHEAVFWMASRFDLLATLFVLLGFLAVERYSVAIVCFALALLSKESAFAFVPIVLAYDVFLVRRPFAAVVRRVVPLLAVIAVYMGVRVIGGGPDAAQGLGHYGKIVLLAGAVVALLAIGYTGSERVLNALAAMRRRLAVAILLVLTIVLITAAVSPASAMIRTKLAFASFAGFYVLSPVITTGGSAAPTFDAADTLYWLSGWLVLALAAFAVTLPWKPRTRPAGEQYGGFNGQLAFLLIWSAAALLPISSMTEGTRYLYLASIGISLLAGWALARVRGHWRMAGLALLAAVVGVSAWQVHLKAQDWAWAGDMTTQAIRLVRGGETDACHPRNILLLTAPVNVRNVYCNFYDRTFEEPASGCDAPVVRAIVRVVGHDVPTSVRWSGAGVIDVGVQGDTSRLVTSRDLRQFDIPLWPPVLRIFSTPIGTVSVAPNAAGQQVELSLRPTFDARAWRFLYYDRGVMRELKVPD